MLVELTDEGRELADRAVELHLAREGELLAGLSRRERDQLSRVGRKLLASL